MKTVREYFIIVTMASVQHLVAQSGRQTTVIVQPTAGPCITTVVQVLDYAADPKTKPANSFFQCLKEAGQVLKTLPASQRKQVFQQVIAGNNNALASSIANWAVIENDMDLAHLIASRIASWSAQDQSAILGNLAMKRDAWMEVPRQLVQAAVNAGRVAQPSDSPNEPVGKAAIILAKSGTPADREMILNLAQLRPYSWGIWMAIAYVGAMDAPRVASASPVYKDNTAPASVRAAAAAALESFDPQAAAFAVSQARTFLAKFSDQDAGLIISLGSKAKPGDSAYQSEADFVTNIHQLAVLLVLKDRAAQQLAFQYVNARNQFISRLCYLIAAVRWPQDLMKLGQGTLSAQEYADLLAIMAMYNPDQAAAAASHVTPDSMAKAKVHVGKVGLAALGHPGHMLKVF